VDHSPAPGTATAPPTQLTETMSARYYRAVALDYDGTLTTTQRPDAAVLEAVAETRRGGRRVVLVTGRILEELEAVFPDAGSAFDGIVAENGAVIRYADGTVRAVASPVAAELEAALLARGVPVRRGRVLLATEAAYDEEVLHEIARLGLGDQLIRNREALMVLPPAITKGTGLLEILGDLGLSRHNTIGVGDAENDHALMEVCELGVAVGNAVEALKARADIVLREPDGAGILALLHGALLRETLRIRPPRAQVRLGLFADGTPAILPASQINVLVTGGTKSGKSHLAGLLAERLIARGYSVCVLDPEGDHVALGRLRATMVVGGTEDLPPIETLERLIAHRFGSLVVDLSLRSPSDKREYAGRALHALAHLRDTRGLPHWLFIDEAHLFLDQRERLFEPDDARRGLCLVTYRPADLSSEALEAVDAVLALPGPETAALRAALTRSAFGSHVVCGALTRELEGLSLGSAVLIDRAGPRAFRLDERASVHVRHWHKYLLAPLPAHRRFFFRAGDRPTGIVAANVAEFHDALQHCEAEAIRHHAAQGDFSRWLAEVIQDEDLAADFEGVEGRLRQDKAVDAESARRKLVSSIEQRYPEEYPHESPVP
jgi:hydroxymethylpyrimidine pyrophosphatase-like HAD family hydrolase